MPLAIGARVGAYEITGALGAGGMGEVYRARDARLGRDVAIKILPAAFASDPDRLSRFEQEARAAAALSHPNIAAVFDVGVEGGTRYIVQEFLPGASLRDVLSTQRSKPLREWLSLASEVADALAAAHRVGIVHRDIKPENIIVTEEGRAKVLDFGLAKLSEPGAGDASSNSPTMLGTMAGAVMGTVGYMSPEQAAGLPADRRTDIFAVGCVLYEMIAGKRPFEGRSAAEVIAHVLHDDPQALSSVRSDVPPDISRIVHKCLVKEPAKRYQHADDLGVDLRDASQAQHRPAAAAPTAGPHKGLATAWWLVIVAATAIAAAFVPGRILDRPAATAPPVVRFEVPADPTGIFNRVVAVSPNGRFLVHTTQNGNGLAIRAIDATESRVLPGTEGARDPAVSPDNRQAVFWSSDQIKRVPLDRGTVVSVGPAPGRPLGISWAADGFIYYGRGAEGIWRIAESNGRPELVHAVKPGQYAHGPQMLTSSGWLIFTRASTVNGWNDATVVAVRPGTAEERVLVEPAHDAQAVPGFLTYVHNGVLQAMVFDAKTAVVSGESVTLAEGIGRSTMDTTGAAFYAVSESMLAYLGGRKYSLNQLNWIDKGVLTPLPVAPAEATQVRLSLDQRRIAARVFENGSNIFVYDVDRPTGTQLSTGGSNRNPLWSHDNMWVYYASDRNGTLDVWRRRADLGGAAELVYGPEGNQVPIGLAKDGTLVFVTLDPGGSTISKVNPAQPRDVTVLVGQPLDAPDGALSRDGRFLAYQVITSSGWQIRIMNLVTGRHTTVGEGFTPAWSPDGAALLFQGGVNVSNVMRVPFSQATGTTGRPELIFDKHSLLPGCCDLAQDGRALALVTSIPIESISVVLNWAESTRRPR